ncbi:MMPL family transporter [Planobispora takensis]|uniref:RND transporter n=1 Tax=Planobispora takensis TaxID=1367882 RepID=A0A8J3T2M4_9ACTN|nr:MMPL family transporter [Planobispora takensis]GII04618.1 RND transporter [Planobispora takensis]
MSSLLYSLGRACYRARTPVIIGWIALLAALGSAAGAVSAGTSDSFAIPGTPSQNALDTLDRRFPQAGGAQAQMIVVAPAGGKVTDAPVKARVEQVADALGEVDGVAAVVDPYDEDVTSALSQDGRAALVTVQLDMAGDDVTDELRSALVSAARPLREAGAVARFGGAAFGTAPPRPGVTEALGVLVALIVLAVTFGSLRAAGMPLLTAVVGVGIAMAAVMAATAFTAISSTVPLLALMIGLAVGIDYALFILSRHRDQLAEGLDAEESAARAVATAGSAVVFAGLTVVIALLGLAVARIPFLTTMGLGAAGAVLVAVLVALTLLPALFGVSGDRLRPRRAPSRLPWRKERRERTGGTRPAERWVRAVTRRPAVTVALVVLAMGALALPARDLRLALPGNGTAPPDSTQRQAYDLVAEHFGPGFNGPLLVTADIIRTTDPVGVVRRIADELRDLPGVAAVTTATPNPTADTGIIALVPEGDPQSRATEDLVTRIRGLSGHFADEYGVEVAVTGHTAVAVDVSARLAGALPPFAVLVIGLSLILLGAVFRSVTIPIKATAGYLLSVGASFGVTAAVFEWGWAAGPLDVARTGPVISFMPIIVMGVLFGLAMDYEVFLVSRMREEYVHGRDARDAVTVGYVSGARVVTAAALIMIAVFAAFVPHSDANVKPIALALAVGVLLDAFVVRMTFVPAVLALLGRAAWWLPGRLDRLLPSFDVEGEALRHRLELAGWPAPGSADVIRAEGLSLSGPRGPVFTGVDLAVPPRTVLVAYGPPGTGKTALLLTLSGRMPFDSGRLKVCGHGLPGEAGAVRERSALAETPGINDLEESLSVEQHVAERLAVLSLRPWVSRAAVTRVLDTIDAAVAAATGAAARLDRTSLVADITPLERRILGLALAMIGSPSLVVVDDADGLRAPDERRALWRALAWLTGSPEIRHPGGAADTLPAVTVVASCQDPAEALAAIPRERLIPFDMTTVHPAREKVR